MKKHLKIITALAIGVAAICGASCTQTGNHNTTKTITDTLSNVQKQAFNQAKAVFYALPSPVETATTLEVLGLKFTDEYLNATSNVEKYNTTSTEALNLGVYTADLSFCALYEQNQAVIEYLASVKKLAEQLGIMGFFNDSTITTIQDNINNKNKIVGIVSESYTRSTNFLEEQERSEIASTVIVGGWVETLYITINMLESIDINKNRTDINEIMINQEYTLEDLIGMLKLFSDDNNIAQLQNKLEELKTHFDKITDEVKAENIADIKEAVTTLRNNFIQ
ncbi:MAG: hypothetical protein MJZ61_01575 [Bacteroidales bacterium]|nr:hypothetical protein [Bacteroidales bacterium]